MNPADAAPGAGPRVRNVEDSEALAIQLAGFADAKMASEIVVLDMRPLVSYTDYLVIVTARNERQASAVADEAYLKLKNEGDLLPGRVEGRADAGWLVLDYLDCVMHVFTPEARDRFRLEELWSDAPRLELAFDGAPSS